MQKKQIIKMLEAIPDNAELVIAEWQDDGYHYKMFNHMLCDPLRKASKPERIWVDGKLELRDVYVLGNRDNCLAHSADEYFNDKFKVYFNGLTLLDDKAFIHRGCNFVTITGRDRMEFQNSEFKRFGIKKDLPTRYDRLIERYCERKIESGEWTNYLISDLYDKEIVKETEV